MRTIFFDCYSGASGDMILGALLDAGASAEAVTEAIAALDLGATVAPATVMKGAIKATHATVTTGATGASRNYRDIVALIEGSGLDARVKARSLAAFGLLAEAEAKIHGVPIDEVHFHEVGSDDAIVDIVGACAALEELRVDRVVVSAIATGRGSADSAHGAIPVPAPAVLEILRGATLYERGTHELITPTGAALLASWADAFDRMPPLKVDSVGYGAGTTDLEWPNVLRVIVGQQESPETSASLQTELIETNLDDMSPELFPYVIERLLAEGALDAWITPVHMKKGRQGAVLSALGEAADTQHLIDIMFRETTTLGIRLVPVTRAVLDRKSVQVEVSGHQVNVKIGYREGQPTTASPEYEDAVSVARATGMALKDVYRAALDALGPI
ncbi:MAG: pyridinium-3,5-bisthiocarboxylic acid mononucleotide nickel chelatase [Actinomycetota bacterium]|jgi:uncharacterized protein (TIGR00299 family) protein|nr:pyridinium-3,5-bisthiocarboxylic acid mononucleotide nickel chelatase [Actinomycetota bacterium]